MTTVGSSGKVMLYNPNQEGQITYLSKINHYDTTESSDEIDLKKYDMVLSCIYFYNVSIRSKPIEPVELVNNLSTFDPESKPVPIVTKDILRLLEYENSYLFLFNTWELIPITESVFYSMNKLIKTYPILKNKIIISSCDFLNTNKLMKHNNFYSLSYDWSYLIAQGKFDKDAIVSKSSNKAKRVALLNRRDNRERFICASYFYTKYKDKCLLSYLSKPNYKYKSELIGESAAKKFYDEIPICIDGSFSDVTWDTTKSLTQYLNQAHAMVIFETNAVEGNNYCQVSEKSYKGILAGMIFLIFTNKPGILKHLKSLGFKTFSPMIDESYDEPNSYESRYMLFIKEIEKICSNSNLEIKILYDKCQSAIEHNCMLMQKNEIQPLL